MLLLFLRVPRVDNAADVLRIIEDYGEGLRGEVRHHEGARPLLPLVVHLPQPPPTVFGVIPRFASVLFRASFRVYSASIPRLFRVFRACPPIPRLARNSAPAPQIPRQNSAPAFKGLRHCNTASAFFIGAWVLFVVFNSIPK